MGARYVCKAEIILTNPDIAGVTLEVGASASTLRNVGHDRTVSVSNITRRNFNEHNSPGVHGLPVLPHEGDDTTGIDLSKVGDGNVSSRLQNNML